MYLDSSDDLLQEALSLSGIQNARELVELALTTYLQKQEEADDLRWDQTFAESQEVLAQLAQEALADTKAGKAEIKDQKGAWDAPYLAKMD
jgi:Arc/MetJ family transcription regulator